MKERPILFTPANAQLVYDGKKTQTRRMFKGTTEHKGEYNPSYLEAHLNHSGWKTICPYGAPGDRLWVRESWGIADSGGRLVDPCINYRGGGQLPLIGHVGPEMWSLACNKDVPYEKREINDADLLKIPDGWRHGMFMPRWACRTVVEITDVRVQKVQGISEEDSIAEGIQRQRLPDLSGNHFHWGDKTQDRCKTAVGAYAKLWDSINGKTHPWGSNPWVWALTFRRVA